MKVLVVGGAGYIGSHVVYELLKENNEVIVFDNLSTGHRSFVPESAKFYLGDITSYEDLENIFSNEEIDLVMHFAGKIRVDESVSKPLMYYYNNVEGVRILLDVMRKYNCKKIVFSSSAAVYGEAVNGVCFEDDYKLPINPYGETKLIGERLIESSRVAYGIEYVIFRYFNVAGADSSLEIGLKSNLITHLIPKAIKEALDNGLLKVFGTDYDTKDGTCVRDYIHVSDIAKAHVLGAYHLINNKGSNIFNLGSNSGYSVLEVINEVNNIIPVKFENAPRREGDPAILIANSKRANDILNWKASKDLSEMIKSDLAFRKLNNK